MNRILVRTLAAIALLGLGGFFLRGISSSGLNSAPLPDASSGNLSLGKSIYDARCSMCHGTDGKSSGIAASFLNPRPRDLTSGQYKFRSTESGSIPTDEDIERTVREGLHATAMPDWKDFIKGDSLSAVVAYAKSFSPRFQNEQPKPVTIGSMVPATQASIESGKKVFDKLQCYTCHGTDGAGKEAVASDLIDDWGREIAATNLTEPWTFRGGSAPRDIYLRFRTGIDGTPMPSFVGSASDKEMWDLANYVVYIGRKPVWEMTASEVAQHYAGIDAQWKANPVARGKYLVRSLGCGDCHTPYNENGTQMEQFHMAGGLNWTLGPYGKTTSANLTSDKATGLGNYSDDEIKRAMTRGIRRDGTRMIPFPMPWTSYANLSDDDIHAVITYLRTLPPVYNKIPGREPLNFFSYLWGKFKMLILKKDFPGSALPGNAGTTREKSSASLSAGKEAQQ